ncbi:DeoR/GlpR family DNA-binding transcription regulator [Bacillus sp. B-jedd]|uniref:DeoR/GlpR family DNA-binding transcription regulator n=1 Tax=Bacillus sp. B-jedd TaxID=1476857 RepID=UPI00051572E5|nr:DeoR/GlpR family DNA-binding transcription regulator [Bacillus sp. B-jedd]CEG28593.1 HTH domain, deoR family transcriptional regulator [Bacillus sp. B-jedd]
MLTPERHRMILQMIKEKPHVKLQEFVDATGASESTIRRDLTQLEEEKLLKRVHGGAERLQRKLLEPSMAEKSSKNLHEKVMIAQYAASLVEKGDCIYLDAGTTVREMIQFLPEKDIVVVTNGLMHIQPLLEKGIECYLIGGYVKQKTNAIIGRGALESLEQYRFDKCFLGVNGIHLQYGYTTPDQEEAMIKEKALSMSAESFILADSSKFSEIAFAKIADLHEASIITDKLDDEHRTLYSSKTDIKVVTT